MDDAQTAQLNEYLASVEEARKDQLRYEKLTEPKQPPRSPERRSPDRIHLDDSDSPVIADAKEEESEEGPLYDEDAERRKGNLPPRSDGEEEDHYDGGWDSDQIDPDESYESDDGTLAKYHPRKKKYRPNGSDSTETVPLPSAGDEDDVPQKGRRGTASEPIQIMDGADDEAWERIAKENNVPKYVDRNWMPPKVVEDIKMNDDELEGNDGIDWAKIMNEPDTPIPAHHNQNIMNELPPEKPDPDAFWKMQNAFQKGEHDEDIDKMPEYKKIFEHETMKDRKIQYEQFAGPDGDDGVPSLASGANSEEERKDIEEEDAEHLAD